MNDLWGDSGGNSLSRLQGMVFLGIIIKKILPLPEDPSQLAMVLTCQTKSHVLNGADSMVINPLQHVSLKANPATVNLTAPHYG